MARISSRSGYFVVELVMRPSEFVGREGGVKVVVDLATCRVVQRLLPDTKRIAVGVAPAKDCCENSRLAGLWERQWTGLSTWRSKKAANVATRAEHLPAAVQPVELLFADVYGQREQEQRKEPSEHMYYS